MKKKNQSDMVWRVMQLFAKLPLALAMALAGALAGLLARLPLKYASAYRVVLLNLLAAYPSLSWAEARHMARRALREQGRTYAELAHVCIRPVDESLARISKVTGETEFLAAVKDSRPLLLLTLHHGSWELSNLYVGVKSQGRRTVILYQPDKSKLLERGLKDARERTGCTLVAANSKGVREALTAMQNGESLGILADHNPGASNNPFVPFFGHSVHTLGLVGRLVMRYRPRVFFVHCYRGEGGARDIHLVFQPAPDVEQADSEQRALEAMNRGLEACIADSPEQYQWTYKRFRRSPSGPRRWYKNSYKLLKKVEAGHDRKKLGLTPNAPVPAADKAAAESHA